MSDTNKDKSNNNDVEMMDREFIKFVQPVLDCIRNKENENSQESENLSIQVSADELQSEKMKVRQDKLSMIEKERDTIKKDRDSIQEDRDNIKKDRDVIKDDRDAIQEDRDAIKVDRDAIKVHIDAIKDNRDAIKDERDSIQEDRDAIQEDRDSIQKDRDAIKEDRDTIKEDKEAIKNSMNAFKVDKDTIEQKYIALTSKLREQVECPVCLEVPTSGPVHVCPNGHFVCSNCKNAKCPTCRGKMFSGKSLLAVNVIENIDHKCKYEECGELFPLEEYKLHLKSCPHRVVCCPGPVELCGQEMALSKVYDHILKECKGSYNSIGRNNATNNNGKFPNYFSYPCRTVPIEALKGFAFCCNDSQLYLSFEKFSDYTVVSFQLLGSPHECQEYEVNIEMHRTDDEDMKGKHVQKFTGEPLSIDMEQEMRKQNGLIVGLPYSWKRFV